MSEKGADISSELMREKDVKSDILNICITASVMLILSFLVYIFRIPNPNIILLTGLALFTSLYGYGAGVTGGIITLIYSMFFFSVDNSFIHYEPVNFEKIIIIAFGVIMNIAFIGHLKHKQLEAIWKLKELNQILKLDNSVLEEATVTDSLTGVKNRFAFRRDYTSYERRNIIVMMLDVDDFKTINDTYGHTVGDLVLKQMGEALIDVFGKAWCYRYGGDEFLVVTDRMDDDCFNSLTAKLAERIGTFLKDDGTPIGVNFSGGYVYGTVRLGDDLRLMLRSADHNLYEAKKAGKNRFVGKEYSHIYAERLKKDPIDTGV